MKAIVAHAAEDLRVDDLPEPEPGRQQVLVRIVYGGVCGSDLHYARNAANGSYRITEPLTLGHEVVGVVERVGPDVRDTYAPGTRVAVHPATPTPPPGGTEGSGLNLFRGGTYLGSASTSPHTQGGFTELLVVEPGQLRALPDGLPLRRAVLAEPLSIALHGVGRFGELVRGASVLVSGAGPIGSLAVAALRAAGAREIVAADLQELPLEVARAVGADEVLRVGRDEVPADRFDLAVEAAGVVPSLETCLAAVRPGGTVLQLGILPAGALPITVSTLIVKELTLLGSQRFDVEMDRAIELLRDDASLDAVVSHTFPIEDAIAAFAQAADASVSSKVVIAVTEDPEER